MILVDKKLRIRFKYNYEFMSTHLLGYYTQYPNYINLLLLCELQQCTGT